MNHTGDNAKRATCRGLHARRLFVEVLENRHMLSGVTLITHGFAGSVDGWVTQMAEAIASSVPNIDQPRYIVEVTDPGRDGGPLSVVNTSRSGPSPTSAETDDPEIVILLDWSDVAGSFSIGSFVRSTVDVSAAVAQALVTPQLLADLPTPLAELPLHLIGHSRGGALVGEIARHLGELGVFVDHVTTLDPHPVDAIRDPFGADFGDAAMAAWENVVFWDNYWRTEGDTSLDFTGEPVNGAHNVQLVESILGNAAGYANEHSDVHLWYHGTIATTGLIDDGSASVSPDAGWYEGAMGPRDEIGYYFSRAVGGLRPSSGVAVGLGGGQGERTAITDHAADRWPSLVEFRITSPRVVNTGDPLNVSYYWHDYDGSAALAFYLDSDRNPYNGTTRQLGEEKVLPETFPQPLDSGTHSIPTSGASPGQYHLLAKIFDATGTRYVYAPEPVVLADVPGFTVTSFDATSAGFTVRMSGDVDRHALNLGDTETGSLGPADVLLTGATTGPVRGSLIVDPSGRSITFLKTGGRLTPDTYTVTLRSANDAFKDLAGNLLDGDGNGTPGDDFRDTFTVAPAEAVAIGIPDFVRGPGQELNLPANSTDGIPVSISDGAGVRTATFRIEFDSNLLNITGATAGANLPAGATAAVDTSVPGRVFVSFQSPDDLPAGPHSLVHLQAIVPTANAGGIYGSQHVLDVNDITITNGAGAQLPAVGDDGLHVAAFLSDVSRNGVVNAADATQLARLASSLDSVLVNFQVTDFQILADVNASGRVDFSDAVDTARFAVQLPVATIPPLPGRPVANVRAGDAAPFLGNAPRLPAVAVWPMRGRLTENERTGERLAVAVAVGAARPPTADNRPADKNFYIAALADRAITDMDAEELPLAQEEALNDFLSILQTTRATEAAS